MGKEKAAKKCKQNGNGRLTHHTPPARQGWGRIGSKRMSKAVGQTRQISLLGFLHAKSGKWLPDQRRFPWQEKFGLSLPLPSKPEGRFEIGLYLSCEPFYEGSQFFLQVKLLITLNMTFLIAFDME